MPAPPRKPLGELPLSRFIVTDALSTPRALPKASGKRPLSPGSTVISPAKKRVMLMASFDATPPSRAISDSAKKTPGKNLLADLQSARASITTTITTPVKTRQHASSSTKLAPSPEIEVPPTPCTFLDDDGDEDMDDDAFSDADDDKENMPVAQHRPRKMVSLPTPSKPPKNTSSRRAVLGGRDMLPPIALPPLSPRKSQTTKSHTDTHAFLHSPFPPSPRKIMNIFGQRFDA